MSEEYEDIENATEDEHIPMLEKRETHTRGHQIDEMTQQQDSSKRHGWSATKYAYNPEQVFYNIFCRFRGTTLPGLCTMPTVWISVILFSYVNICKSAYPDGCGHPDSLPPLSPDHLRLSSVLVVFFVSFYSNQCYTKFMAQYNRVKLFESQIKSVVYLANLNYSGKGSKKMRREVYRLLCAAYYMMYSRLYSGSKMQFDLDTAYEDGYLSKEEAEDLQVLKKGIVCARILSWAHLNVQAHADAGVVGKAEAGKICDKISQVRDSLDQVTAEAQMQPPLAYYHVNLLLNSIFSFVFSYASPFLKDHNDPWLSTAVWIIVVWGMFGMRAVSEQMADPYGDDDMDLPVSYYIFKLTELVMSSVHEDKKVAECRNNDTPHTFSRKTPSIGHEFEN